MMTTDRNRFGAGTRSADYETHPRNVAPYQPPNPMERVSRIETALKQERWLPIGMRSLLASELPWIRRRLASHSRRWQAGVAMRVHELTMASFRYGPELLDSEAIAQLRMLDLELSHIPASSEVAEDQGEGVEQRGETSSQAR